MISKLTIMFGVILCAMTTSGATAKGRAPDDSAGRYIVPNLTKYEKKYVALSMIQHRDMERIIDGNSYVDTKLDIIDAYNLLFGGSQSHINMLLNRDLVAIFDAADMADFYMPSTSRYLNQMIVVFNQIKEREAMTGSEARSLYGAMFAARDFVTMDEFRNQVRTIDGQGVTFPVINVVNDVAKPRKHEVLLVDADRHQLRSSIVNINHGVIVVVFGRPKCHFTVNAMTDIDSIPYLRAVMAKHAVWLLPVTRSMDLRAVRVWNKSHPDAKFAIAYSTASWPNINESQVPTFTFFKNGRLVMSIAGWPKEGRAKELEKAFVSLGVTGHGTTAVARPNG